MTAISVFLSFSIGSVFRLHCALEDPQKSPFTLSTETGVPLNMVMILLSGAAVISIFDEVKKQSHLEKNNYFTKSLRKGEDRV